MRSVILLPLLAVTIFSAQASQDEGKTVHMKAGDFAPDITFAKMLNSPDSAPWGSANLLGRLTVIAFFPDIIENVQTATQWNALIDQFADKPVQFIWITEAEQSTLSAWFRQNPMKGWVFRDPAHSTSKAFGLEHSFSSGVIINAEGKIVGFPFGALPDAIYLNAALEGRITTEPVTKANLSTVTEKNLVHLDAEPRPIPMPWMAESEPDYPPSYNLHVSPSQTEGLAGFSSPKTRILKGYQVKDVIHKVYNINLIRVDFPASLDDGKRYDLALVLPKEESPEKIDDLFRQAFEEYFHIVSTRENRLQDVYVITATDRRPPPSKLGGDNVGFGGSSSAIAYETTSADLPDSSLSLSGVVGVTFEGTMDDFCRTLESMFDRPVVNETNLKGQFKFDVKRNDGEQKAFLDRLRDQTGLLITPDRRSIEMLVFRPR